MKAGLSLKTIIIASVLTLVILSVGVGLYVLNMSTRTNNGTNTNTSTNNSQTKDNAATSVAKQETVKTTTVTPDMIGSDGNVDLSKVLEKNQ